ncbi:MAG: NAD(P)H-dependent oxidoreductase [Planctomycetota bacterium]|nr:NAD(P)H-dependent oxidoreductase [Planctomycetota bacterium]
MSAEPKILAFAGSLRQESYNKKLMRIAAAAARRAGADVTELDLGEYPLPVYDGDLEADAGLPENARKLKALMKAHGGFLIASPEYNSSISGTLKNAIDWTSRPEPDEPPLVCFRGKTAAIMSASPGALGGLRGLVHLRAILGNIGVLVLPDQKAISSAAEAFAENGSLKDPKQLQAIEQIGTRLAEVVTKLA